MRIWRLVLLVALLPAVGCRREQPGPPSSVAVSNSYLECAVRDALGTETPVFRMSDPATCPGHFDVTARQVTELNACRVFLRFDFQQALDARVRDAVEHGLRIGVVSIAGGLCEPESYLAACRQTADAVVGARLLDRPTADARLKSVAQRIAERAAWCHRQMAEHQGTAVLASVHQEALCNWLGLQVAATFRAADVLGAREMEQSLAAGRRAGAKLVIANRPEGRQVADALARDLGARVVVLDNFPALEDGQASFDDLLADNVGRVVTALEH